LFFLAWVKARKKIPLSSPFGFFVFYQLIYNLTPWLAFSLDIHLFSLSDQADLLNLQLFHASICDFTLGIVLLLMWRQAAKPRMFVDVYSVNPKGLFFLFFPPTLIMVYFFGWNSVTASLQSGAMPGLMHSLASFMKLFLIAVYIHCLQRDQLSRTNIIILILLIFLLFIDGARTNFMMIIALVLFFYDRGGKKNLNWKYIAGLSIFGLLLVLSRSLKLQNNFSQNILDTFLAEGVIGSYMNLQTIYVLKHLHTTPLMFGKNYFIDPLLTMVPFASVVGGSFESWITNISSLLIEPYAPVGGFYYMAESFASFGWAGPALVTGGYAALTTYLTNYSIKNQGIYLLYLTTFGCLFSKTQFLNCFKLFILIALFYYLLNYILKFNSQKPSQSKVVG
jgi:hypothetical protein